MKGKAGMTKGKAGIAYGGFGPVVNLELQLLTVDHQKVADAKVLHIHIKPILHYQSFDAFDCVKYN